jgi:signal transduction histidine kinase
MKFENHEEKLKHIGLMCCANLHDAFSNLSDIVSLCENKEITEKERIKLIKEKANNTYELFRVIERYRNQSEKSKTETFSASDLGKKIEKYFKLEKLELNIIKDFEITCKKTLLLQILVNLADNAYKHNNKNYNDKKILLTIDTNEITLSDNGIGIPDENKDKIFDLFFTTKDLDKLYGEHNGIGLYGVKEHIKSLGYTIEVKNNTILSGANFVIKIK